MGTVVIDKNTNDVLWDFTKPGERFVVVKGGEGGLGNSHFATSVNQAPKKFTYGKKGEERELLLILKTIADIGIVGLPNVGKSTLLSVLTNANPKIGDYPFTTLHPELGVLEISYDKSLVLVDMPGIIENAHEGAGLGLEFLRHIERAKAIFLAIDLSSEDAVRDFNTLYNELSLYDNTLPKRIKAVVGTKLDKADENNIKSLKHLAQEKNLVFIPISSVTFEGIEQLKNFINTIN